MGCFCVRPQAASLPELSAKRRVTYDTLTISPSLYVQENQEQFTSVYSIDKAIGKGGYSCVYRCTHLRTGQVRAAKVIRKMDVDEAILASGVLLSEVQIHKELDHPNIVRLYEFFEDTTHYYFVQELCPAGELFDMILEKGKLSEKEAALIMEQLTSTVAYLHSRNIIHRDIKPENILLQDNGDIKLIDFDAAVLMDVRRQVIGSVGTAFYMAPEVLNGTYNEKCDVWSMGVVLYILLTGHPPFSGHSGKDVIKEVMKGTYSLEGPDWEEISPSAKDLVRKMLVRNPHKRISAQQAHLHPWTMSEKSALSASDRSLVLRNLGQFQASTKVKDAIKTFICTHILAGTELKRITSLFKACDRDGDGVVSKEDLIPYLSAEMGVEKAEMEVMGIIAQVDTDTNGCIDFTEFIKANIDQQILLSKANLALAFSHFDKTGVGYITAEDLKEWLGNGTLEDDDCWVRMLHDEGICANGLIDLKVFEKLLLEDNASLPTMPA